jgi:hypothetical protein
VSKLCTSPQKLCKGGYNLKITFAFGYNMFQRILAYHLAILVLLTNVGIPVFTHVCHGQGTVRSSLLLPSGGCCGKKQQVEQPVQACHSTKKCEKPGIQQKPCCENKVSIARTDSDYFDGQGAWALKSLGNIFVSLPTSSATIPTSAFSQHIISFQPHAPPVQLHGRSLLVSKQTFRC